MMLMQLLVIMQLVTYKKKNIDMKMLNEIKEEINSFIDSLNEGKDNVGHVEKVGNQILVDSNFLNFCKGVLPNSELVHLGMGDFMLKTPKGEITFNRSGKLVGIGDDFVGRPHRATDNKGGKLIDELIAEMVKKKKAVINESKVNEESEEVNEGFTDQTGAKSAFFKQYPEAYDLFDDKMKKFVDKAKMYLDAKSIIFTDGKSGIQITKNAPFSIIKKHKNIPNNLDVLSESEEDVFKPLDESIKVVLSELSNLKLDESIEDIEDITNLVTEINLKINDLRNAIIDRQ